MIDDFITIVTDEDFEGLDEYTGPSTMSGVNIKTGSYGLFLVALDECTVDTERATINEAMEALDEIQDCTMSNAMDPYFPPDDLNYKTTLALANTIIQLNDITEGEHASKISDESVGKFTEIAYEKMGVRNDYLEDKYIENILERLEEYTDDGNVEDES